MVEALLVDPQDLAHHPGGQLAFQLLDGRLIKQQVADHQRPSGLGGDPTVPGHGWHPGSGLFHQDPQARL